MLGFFPLDLLISEIDLAATVCHIFLPRINRNQYHFISVTDFCMGFSHSSLMHFDYANSLPTKITTDTRYISLPFFTQIPARFV